MTISRMTESQPLMVTRSQHHRHESSATSHQLASRHGLENQVLHHLQITSRPPDLMSTSVLVDARVSLIAQSDQLVTRIRHSVVFPDNMCRRDLDVDCIYFGLEPADRVLVVIVRSMRCPSNFTDRTAESLRDLVQLVHRGGLSRPVSDLLESRLDFRELNRHVSIPDDQRCDVDAGSSIDAPGQRRTDEYCKAE